MSEEMKKAPQFITCDVNRMVWVKLNSYGVNILKELHIFQNGCKAGSPLFTLPPTDAAGFSKWRLWELMYVYGGSMGQGLASPWDGDMFLSREVTP